MQGGSSKVTNGIFILSPLIKMFYSMNHDGGLDTAFFSSGCCSLLSLNPCLEEGILPKTLPRMLKEEGRVYSAELTPDPL